MCRFSTFEQEHQKPQEDQEKNYSVIFLKTNPL
jgi:hypothetical protein